MEMLKARAAIEKKLKQKGVFRFVTPRTDRPQKHLKPLNGKLESCDDVTVQGSNQGHASSLSASKVSQLVAANRHKSKIVSGDDDLAQGDDVLSLRKLRALMRAGMKSNDDRDIKMKGSEDGDSGDDLYKLAKQNQAAKLIDKAVMRSRSSVPSLLDTVDDKPHVTYEMAMNSGLTRSRNKDTKNPRINYRIKYEKQINLGNKINIYGGQVLLLRKPVQKKSVINPSISQIRFKN